MRGGQLRHRMALQRRAISTDAEGDSSDGWVTVKMVSAQITPVGGRELAMAGQMEMKLSHQVTLRYRRDLEQTISSASATTGHNMRLLWGARTLDIQLVEDPEGRQRRLEILCLEHQD
jgi:SPP1 family predicted phage head-tail adaptor